MSKPKPTFGQWKKAATTHIGTLLVGLGEVFDKRDSYDLKEAAKAAYKAGRSPGDFIEDMFAEDLASQENDRLLYEESLEQEDDYGDEQWD
jgi:hypothetical protein